MIDADDIAGLLRNEARVARERREPVPSEAFLLPRLPLRADPELLDRAAAEIDRLRDRDGRWGELLADEAGETLRLVEALGIDRRDYGDRPVMDAMLDRIGELRDAASAALEVLGAEEVHDGNAGDPETLRRLGVVCQLTSALAPTTDRPPDRHHAEPCP